MWAGGDAAFLVAMLLAVWVWLRAEEREGVRIDAKLDRERASKERAEQLAAAARASGLGPRPPLILPVTKDSGCPNPPGNQAARARRPLGD